MSTFSQARIDGKMKIVADENIPFLHEAFGEFGDIHAMPGRSITRESLEDATMLLVRSVTPVSGELLDQTPVKFVATATIGTDHVDTEYLNQNVIGFASAPGSNADSVAEYVIASLLHLAHRNSFKIEDKVIGVIGCGNVGSRVFKRAQALGMRCLVCDPPKQRITGSDFFRPLEELLRESDILTLHVPLTAEGEDATFRMINADFLDAAKKGVILINTSRGKVHDEKALLSSRGRLGGIVLDVWEHEPAINPEMIHAADIATPHIAGYSYDGKVRGTEMIYQAACAFFFRESRWNAQATLEKENGGVINIEKSQKPVTDAVLSAYPIGEDDERTRMLAKKSAQALGDAFDALRKNYRRRLEFPHFTVRTGQLSILEQAALNTLGFQTASIG